MIVVSNTTPIISLASINQLEVLNQLFGEITISEAVYQELKAKESFGFEETDYSFIKVNSIKGKMYKELLLNQLDIGELETIILAKELNADFVIIDENLAYKIAKNNGLNVIRTLSVLLKAKQKKIIKNVKPLLDDMLKKGRWYSEKVYIEFLKKAGEI